MRNISHPLLDMLLLRGLQWRMCGSNPDLRFADGPWSIGIQRVQQSIQNCEQDLLPDAALYRRRSGGRILHVSETTVYIYHLLMMYVQVPHSWRTGVERYNSSIFSQFVPSRLPEEGSVDSVIYSSGTSVPGLGNRERVAPDNCLEAKFFENIPVIKVDSVIGVYF
jgi:hypothetical protein